MHPAVMAGTMLASSVGGKLIDKFSDGDKDKNKQPQQIQTSPGITEMGAPGMTPAGAGGMGSPMASMADGAVSGAKFAGLGAALGAADGMGEKGGIKGVMANLATYGAGIAGGAKIKMDQLDPNATPADRIKAITQGGLAGGITTFALKSQDKAIDKEGGGLQATLSGALGGAAASTLEKDGPNMFKAALIGGSSGYAINSVGDSMRGRLGSGVTNALTDTLQGTALGYNTFGDGRGAAMGSAMGASHGLVESLARGELNIPGLGGSGAKAASPSGLNFVKDDGAASISGLGGASASRTQATPKLTPQHEDAGISL